MMSRRIKAIVKDPGDPVGKEICITNALWNLQTLVDGYIEIVTLANGPDKLVIVCDEEGKLKGKPFNFRIQTMERIDHIVGTAIICGAKDDSLASVPIDLATWERMLRRWGNE